MVLPFEVLALTVSQGQVFKFNSIRFRSRAAKRAAARHLARPWPPTTTQRFLYSMVSPTQRAAAGGLTGKQLHEQRSGFSVDPSRGSRSPPRGGVATTRPRGTSRAQTAGITADKTAPPLSRSLPALPTRAAALTKARTAVVAGYALDY